MDIDQQLQTLIDQSPQDGVTPAVIKNAVNPVLKAFTAKLKYSEYFVYQSVEGNWLLTTLNNRQHPNLEKKVIYAFSRLDDARQFQGNGADAQLTAQPMPTTHILFQLFSLKRLDSIIFMETPGDLNQGTEIHRQALQSAIQKQLAEYQKQAASNNRFA